MLTCIRFFYFKIMTTENLIVSEIQVSYKHNSQYKPQIRSSKDSYELLKPLFPRETIQMQEQVVVLYLNRANQVIGSFQLSKGGLTSAIVDIRLILSIALKTLASGFILAHNHPSGNLCPSETDIKLTRKIREAARLVDIELIDHLILSSDSYYSFTDEGLM